jgi:broad specificity phosphatase PhoE
MTGSPIDRIPRHLPVNELAHTMISLRIPIRRLLICLFAGLLALPHSVAWASDKRALVLLLRHAIAPGGGDPPGFDLNDCSTQRNLSAEGREQSRQIGRQLQALGLEPAQIWSSQWCRALDTARYMQVGDVKPLPALNSFFADRTKGPAQMAQLEQFLRELDPNGGPYLMTSHQVVVSALANTWVNSGDGVWLVLTGQSDSPWQIYPANTTSLELPPGISSPSNTIVR